MRFWGGRLGAVPVGCAVQTKLLDLVVWESRRGVRARGCDLSCVLCAPARIAVCGVHKSLEGKVLRESRVE
jgi:hypothetical protein